MKIRKGYFVNFPKQSVHSWKRREGGGKKGREGGGKEGRKEGRR